MELGRRGRIAVELAIERLGAALEIVRRDGDARGKIFVGESGVDLAVRPRRSAARIASIARVHRAEVEREVRRKALRVSAVQLRAQRTNAIAGAENRAGRDGAIKAALIVVGEVADGDRMAR